ncbi:MAG: hypothetical protein H3C47_12625 [Candidatus Cloacimonetes bacterium]|nr:hypothetical protein [Candidatus Cloacimonadota bacterium]
MNRETKLNLVFALVFLGLGGLGFITLSSFKKPVSKISSADIRPVLRTMPAKIVDHQIQIKAFGTLRPMDRFIIKSEVTGSIRAMHQNLEAGGVILEGEVLFEVDPTPFEIQLSRSRANLEKAQATLQQRKVELQSLTQSYNTEKESLRIISDEEIRYRDMLKQGTVSRQEYDARLNQKQRQEVTYQNALNRYLTQPALIAQAQADLMNAKASLNQSEYDLSKTRVISPLSGKILRKSIFKNQYVSPGTDLGELVGLERLELEVPLPSHELKFLFPDGPEFLGMPESSPVNLPIHSLGLAIITPLTPSGNKPLPASIKRVSPVLDPQKKTLSFFLEIHNSLSGAGAAGILLPGTFCEITIPGQTLKAVVKIPRLSIREPQVQLVEDGLVRWREFIPLRDEGSFIVGQLSLSDTSEFVLNATEVFKDGTAVRTVKEEKRL